MGISTAAELPPPEHRGLRLGPNFQRSDLAGRELETFGEGEGVYLSPASGHC